MKKETETIALIIASALISIVPAYFQTEINNFAFPVFIILFFIPIFLFLFFGFGYFFKIYKNIVISRRNSRSTIKIGILNDIPKEVTKEQMFSWSDYSSDDWKKLIEKEGSYFGKKLKINLIQVNHSFTKYNYIINPTSGVYPEIDIENKVTLKKILDYVSNGGEFINVADIPGYWAYNIHAKHVLNSFNPIFIPDPIYPFLNVPFMQNLGLNALNVQGIKEHNLRFHKIFKPYIRILENESQILHSIDMFRSIVISANVISVVEPIFIIPRQTFTPLCYIIYGKGKFLFSLFNLSDPKNEFIKQVIADLIINQVDKKLEKKHAIFKE